MYFAVEVTARQSHEILEASLSLRDTLKDELRQTFANQQRRVKDDEMLQRRSHRPNESVTSFFEDILRLMKRAYPTAGEDKVRYSMRWFRSHIFGGLVRYSPTTAQEFTTEAVNIQQVLLPRASNHRRAAVVDILRQSRCDSEALVEDLRSIIRNVVRE